MIANPLRSETLARGLLKSFFQVDIPAPPRHQPRQPADMLVPLRPVLVEGEVMLKATLPPWRRSDPTRPQARSAAIAPRHVRDRKPFPALWLKTEADDWKVELLSLVRRYELGQLFVHADPKTCTGSGCVCLS